MRGLFVAALFGAATFAAIGCEEPSTFHVVRVPHDGGLGALGAEGDSGICAEPCEGGIPGPPPVVPDPNYPTPHGSVPLLPFGGANVLDAPRIVTVTFDGDASRAFFEGFDDVIATTPWWDAVSAGYCDARGKCVGHGANGGHVHMPLPGASYADTAGTASSSLKQYIAANIQSGAFPAPDANTIYMLYFLDATTITLDGKVGCNEFQAFHNAMTLVPPGGVSAVTFAYAIMPRCQDADSVLTFAASHELIEAATDPVYDAQKQSYTGWGSQHDAWDFLGGGEVADRCFDFVAAGGKRTDVYLEGEYSVARSFSNVAAAASHDPCVPAESPELLPYFNVAPQGSDVLTMSVGQTLTLPLVAFSDAPLPPFAIDVTEQTELLGGTNVLALALDRTTAQNGQRLSLTVTLQAKPATSATFVVTSTLGPWQHKWTFFVRS